LRTRDTTSLSADGLYAAVGLQHVSQKMDG
jgi:hypothetical protein